MVNYKEIFSHDYMDELYHQECLNYQTRNPSATPVEVDLYANGYFDGIYEGYDHMCMASIMVRVIEENKTISQVMDELEIPENYRGELISKLKNIKWYELFR